MAHSITSESEDAGLSADSPLTSDGDNLGGSSSGGVVLKKGPWTSAEDAILVNYVKRHGEGNWNAVQKHSGLLRCGKSCRLRWANHLRPNLKKGAFTSEEERLIIELHSRMGNKWARMAAHLPGRTDNEIKNYWNTRVKRRHRAGLPLYPPELCVQTEPENHLNSPGLYDEDQRCHNILQNSGFKIADAMFDSLNSLPFTSEFSDISSSGSLVNGFGSPHFFNFVPQTLGLLRRAQEQDEPMSDYSGDAANEASPFDRAQNDSCENKMSQPFGLYFAYDPPDHTEKLLFSDVNQESHFMPNDIFSASKPFAGAEKLELPSLQYEDTVLGVWDPAPESLDSLVHSPRSRALPSHCPSPRSSGLLEALVYEAKALSKSDNQFYDKSTSSIISPADMSDGSAHKPCSMEFKGYLDPTSPSDNSMESIFNECPPTDTIGSSLEEKIPVGHANSEEVDLSWIQFNERNLDFSRPDAILGSCWLPQSASCSKQRGSVNDTTAAFLGDDLGTELKSVSYGTSAFASSWGLSSCIWNNMPAVCQLSDLP